MISTDAQADPGKQPSGGFILLAEMEHTIFKTAGCVVFEEELLDLWGYNSAVRARGGNCIALAEAAMIPLALYHNRHIIRDRDVIMFIDNSVALFTMVKGVSNQPHICRSSQLAAFLCFRKNVRVWYEFVPSKANWSDSVSRELLDCPFCAKHGIPISVLQIPKDWYACSRLMELFKSII